MRKNFYPYLLFICLGCLVLLSGCGAKRATAGYGGSEPHYYFLGEYDGKLLCGERDIENDDSPLFLWDMETDTKTELTGVRGDEIMNYGQDTLANCG